MVQFKNIHNRRSQPSYFKQDLLKHKLQRKKHQPRLHQIYVCRNDDEQKHAVK